MKYNEVDFLEQFDEYEECTEEYGPFFGVYRVFRNNDYINITLYFYESRAYFYINSVHFVIYDIKEIICDKNQPGIVRFLFYKYEQKYPIVILQVRPDIALRVDIEQTGCRIIPK